MEKIDLPSNKLADVMINSAFIHGSIQSTFSLIYQTDDNIYLQNLDKNRPESQVEPVPVITDTKINAMIKQEIVRISVDLFVYGIIDKHSQASKLMALRIDKELDEEG